MTTSHAAFLAACLDAPDDDTVRLVYADFLRDEGDAGEQLLGRWIWAGVTLAPVRLGGGVGWRPDPDDVQASAITEAMEVAHDVILGHVHRLFGISSNSVAWSVRWDNAWDEYRAAVEFSQGVTIIYRRGMIDEVGCKLTDWHQVAAKVLPVAPVRLWRFAERKWLTLSIGRDPEAWEAKLTYDRPEIKMLGVSFGVGPSGQPVETGPAEGRIARQVAHSTADHRTREGLIRNLCEGHFYEMLQDVVNVVGFRELGVPGIPDDAAIERIREAMESGDLLE